MPVFDGARSFNARPVGSICTLRPGGAGWKANFVQQVRVEGLLPPFFEEG
jgi:hypothetical protein